MITFKLVPHTVLPDTTTVEIWIDVRMVGTIYPVLPNGIRLITSHADDGPRIESRGYQPLMLRQNFDTVFPIGKSNG